MLREEICLWIWESDVYSCKIPQKSQAMNGIFSKFKRALLFILAN